MTLNYSEIYITHFLTQRAVTEQILTLFLKISALMQMHRRKLKKHTEIQQAGLRVQFLIQHAVVNLHLTEQFRNM